jgi:hypothetical protein
MISKNITSAISPKKVKETLVLTLSSTTSPILDIVTMEGSGARYTPAANRANHPGKAFN